MRIALISNEGGGISSVTHGLAEALAKRKIHVTVFTGTPYANRNEKVNDYLNLTYLRFLDFPSRNLWFQLQNFHSLLTHLKDYDLIHGVSPEASAILSICKGKLEKPFVVTVHAVPRSAQRAFLHTPFRYWTLKDLGLHVIEHPWHEFAVRACLKFSDQVVACSFTTLNELKSYNIKHLDTSKTSVIYNGIDFNELDYIKLNNRSSDQEQKGFTVVFAGRLFWTKGITYLLEAMKVVSLTRKDVYLKVFGKGPYEQRIKRLVTNLGLKHNVFFQGYVPHDRMLIEIMNCDLVAVPSIYEAQPMIALEAMASKKPVLSFDLPFGREIIRNSYNGFLVKAFNIKQLAYRIEELSTDRQLCLKLGLNAYDYAKKEHDWDIQIDKYLSVYNKALKNQLTSIKEDAGNTNLDFVGN